MSGRRDVSWLEIVEIEYSRFNDALKLRLRDGTTAAISTQMIGFGHLCRALVEHVKVDPELRAALSDFHCPAENG